MRTLSKLIIVAAGAAACGIGLSTAVAQRPLRTIITNGHVERRPATLDELAFDAAEARLDAAADAADHCGSGPTGRIVVAAPGRYGRDQQRVTIYCQPMTRARLRSIRLAALRQARAELPYAREASPQEIERARRRLDDEIMRLERGS